MRSKPKIFKNTPLPTPCGGRGTKNTGKYATDLKALKVGWGLDLGRISEQVVNSYYTAAKNLGIRISTRKINGGFKLWRIK